MILQLFRQMAVVTCTRHKSPIPGDKPFRWYGWSLDVPASLRHLEGMDAFPGGRGVLLGYGKKTENLMLWDMAEERAIHVFQSQPSPVLLA